MLKIWVNRFDEDVIYDIDAYFESVLEDEWLLDPFVQDMIWDIDKSKVESVHKIESTVLGPIPPHYLSGGVKTLICLLKESDTGYLQDVTNCGDNCAKWLQRIGEKKDIEFALGYSMHLDKDEVIDVMIMNTGKTAKTYEEYMRAFLEAFTIDEG